MLKNGEYGQLFFARVDMVGSEQVISSISPEQYRKLNGVYTSIVAEEVQRWGGISGAWQGDGAVLFLGTGGDEDDIMRAGEAMSRAILDRLFAALPERRFRMGAASAPARFWTDVGRLIKSSGVVLAARLEDEARTVVNGSVLLIPSEIYEILDEAVRALYAPAGVLLGGVAAYAYIPQGAGRLLKAAPKTGAEVRVREKISFFDFFDPDWVFKDTAEIYTALTVHPVELTGTPFDTGKHGDWIRNNYLSLPLGKPVFSKERTAQGKLIVYHAAGRDDKPLRAACFYKNGVFTFADRSWRDRYSGRDVFRAEDALEELKGLLAFAASYYGVCLAYTGRVMAMLHAVNLSGRSRESSPGGRRLLVYQNDFSATVTVPAGELGNGAAAQFLYNQLAQHS